MLSVLAHNSSGVHDEFWIITTGIYRVPWMYLGQRTRISFRLSDLRYLNTIIIYAISAMVSAEYIEPLPPYSKNIFYPQLYEELKTLTIM